MMAAASVTITTMSSTTSKNCREFQRPHTPAKCSLFTLISVKEKVFVCLTKNTFLPLAAAPAVAVVVDDVAVVVASS